MNAIERNNVTRYDCTELVLQDLNQRFKLEQARVCYRTSHMALFKLKCVTGNQNMFR